MVESCGAITLRSRIYGYKARRRLRVVLSRPVSDSSHSVFPSFFLTSISISQPLVQCWCPRCSHGCVSRVCLRSPSFAQGNFSLVSQGTGNEGTGVQRGKKLPGWEGDAGCLAKCVGAGLGGRSWTNYCNQLVGSPHGFLHCVGTWLATRGTACSPLASCLLLSTYLVLF